MLYYDLFSTIKVKVVLNFTGMKAGDTVNNACF